MDAYDGRFLKKLFSKIVLGPNGCWEIHNKVSHPPKDNWRPRACYKRMSMNAARIVAHIFHKLELDSKQQYACHYCDNAFCVNPDHLYVGSPSDNVNDAIRRGRLVYRRKTSGEYY